MIYYDIVHASSQRVMNNIYSSVYRRKSDDSRSKSNFTVLNYQSKVNFWFIFSSKIALKGMLNKTKRLAYLTWMYTCIMIYKL